MEDGRLTNGKGRTVDFRNAVLVMTSNVGSAAIYELAGRDPERVRQEAQNALRATFRPEFLNRIDDIILFKPLGHEQLERIVDLQVKEVARLLAERNITIDLTSAARELVLKDGYDPAYGARPLRRSVQRLIQDPLALEILDGKILPGEHVIADVDARSGQIQFERKPAAAEPRTKKEASSAAAGRRNR
jgi:ATP-dependent Clp protease ATP-binding subunit ClpB